MSYSTLPTNIRACLTQMLSPLPLQLHIDCWGKDQLLTHETDNSLPKVILKINHPGVLRTLFLSQDPLILVEAYLQGFLDFIGDIEHLMGLDKLSATGLNRTLMLKAWAEALTLPRLPISLTEKLPWQKLQLRTRERDKAVIKQHYDVSNDFFRLCLDPLMVYSCAYFEHPEMSLKEAQEAKLDRICRKLKLQPGDYLLDIGCGWGALLRWAVTRYGVKGYGITLSQEQLAFNRERIAQEGLDESLKVELLDYRDLPQEPTFDKIVSVGMVEHIGVKNYPVYFQGALSALKPGGLFLNHGITAADKWDGSSLNERFIQRYIFPDSDYPRLFEILTPIEEAGWEIVDVDAWRPHYAKTLRCWAANLEAAMDKASALIGDRQARIWQLYCIGCALAFEQNHTGIYQALLRRRSDREWNLPLTRKDWLC
jgi:cyclopropane-fatty-acyl-phospholipid synthase